MYMYMCICMYTSYLTLVRGGANGSTKGLYPKEMDEPCVAGGSEKTSKELKFKNLEIIR